MVVMMVTTFLCAKKNTFERVNIYGKVVTALEKKKIETGEKEGKVLLLFFTVKGVIIFFAVLRF